MAETREFTSADIVCALDGKLIVPIGRMYALLGWMTGESLMTHQLPRAMDECNGSLAAQHPDLAEVVVPEGLNTWEKVTPYVDDLNARYGSTRQVVPLAAEDHTSIDPIAELRMMLPDAKIILAEFRDGQQ